jgi:hypothetical protein
VFSALRKNGALERFRKSQPWVRKRSVYVVRGPRERILRTDEVSADDLAVRLRQANTQRDQLCSDRLHHSQVALAVSWLESVVHPLLKISCF